MKTKEIESLESDFKTENKHSSWLKNDKPKIDYNKPLTGNIRHTLKVFIQKELEQLPDTLKELDTVQRLSIVCKLIPYVLPKVESVTHTQGEPINQPENGFEW